MKVVMRLYLKDDSLTIHCGSLQKAKMAFLQTAGEYEEQGKAVIPDTFWAYVYKEKDFEESKKPSPNWFMRYDGMGGIIFNSLKDM